MSNNPIAYDIGVCVIAELDSPRVLDFLRSNYFLEEPLIIGTEPKQSEERYEELTMSYVEHETSLMAVDQQSGAIVGVVLAKPNGPDETDLLLEAAAVMPFMGGPKCGIALNFLAHVEQETNVCQRYKVNKVLHAYVVAVDAQMRGQNIGGRLMNELKALGKELKYELVTIHCTSYYAAQLCERLGWECVNAVYYKDYVDEDQRQIINPGPPHECCKSYAIQP